MQRTVRAGLALVVAAALVSACAETETTSQPTTADTFPATQPTEASTATSDSAPVVTETTAVSGPSPEVQWALDYVGGTPSAASGDPVKFGFASSSDFAPDVDAAADAAADYVNSKLGGVGGRPLEIVHCKLSVAEDGAKCGAQFANDASITIAMTGLALAGSGDFYAALSGKKPVYTAAPSSLDDFITTVSSSYYAGALGAAFGAAGFVLNDLKPKVLGILVTDDVAGRGGYAVVEPILKSSGADVRPVFVQPTATAPEVEAALQAVQVDQLDTLVLGVFEQGCIAAYDALKNLGIDPLSTSIVAVGPCYGAAVQQHMADVGEKGILPNGWYFTGSGYNLFTGDAASGTDTLIDVLAAAGQPKKLFSVAVPEAVTAVITMVKHLNGLAGDYSLAAVDGAIRGFTGPAMAVAGPQACGAPPVFKGVCSSRASVQRYLDGAWQDTHSGDNSVDFSPYVAPAG